MKDVINIGLLGAGNVGGGVLRILEKNSAYVAERAGVPLQITKVLVRHPAQHERLQKKYMVVSKAEEIINDPEIDIVVELMGRVHPAREYIELALKNGKNVVTANKDVIAEYGAELFPLADAQGVDFMFEAAVGGGIPIIRPLKSCLAANRLSHILGIVNGTTNYMLTRMADAHLSYAEALVEAQKLGYAESDPTADVEGLDAARKIAILTSIGFNTQFSLADVTWTQGISSIDYCDIEYGRDLGYVIKLLGEAQDDPAKGVCASVYPVLVPRHHPLAGVSDAFNAIFVTGDSVGDAMFMARGAGRFPTASAVCGDIIDVARNLRKGSCGRVPNTIKGRKPLCPIAEQHTLAYIRLHVLEKPGVLATIATVFSDNGVSLKTVVQKSYVPRAGGEEDAELVVITHDVTVEHLKNAIEALKVCPVVSRVCTTLRVLEEL